MNSMVLVFIAGMLFCSCAERPIAGAELLEQTQKADGLSACRCAPDGKASEGKALPFHTRAGRDILPVNLHGARFLGVELTSVQKGRIGLWVCQQKPEGVIKCALILEEPIRPVIKLQQKIRARIDFIVIYTYNSTGPINVKGRIFLN